MQHLYSTLFNPAHGCQHFHAKEHKVSYHTPGICLISSIRCLSDLQHTELAWLNLGGVGTQLGQTYHGAHARALIGFQDMCLSQAQVLQNHRILIWVLLAL